VLGGVCLLSRRAMADWVVPMRAASPAWDSRPRNRGLTSSAEMSSSRASTPYSALTLGWPAEELLVPRMGWSSNLLCLAQRKFDLGAERLLRLLRERGLSGPLALPSASARPSALARRAMARLLPIFIDPGAQ
jgi:hypothetical protein